MRDHKLGDVAFSMLIGSILPGLGSTIQAASARYHQPVAIGTKVTATVAVKEIRHDQALVLLDCRCNDASGALIADAIIEVRARDNEDPQGAGRASARGTGRTLPRTEADADRGGASVLGGRAHGCGRGGEL